MNRSNQKPAQNNAALTDDQQVAVASIVAAAVAIVKSAQDTNETRQQKETAQHIDFIELLYHVLSKIRRIIAAVLVGALVAGIYAFLIAVPQYEATSKLYIMGQDDVSLSLSDLQVGALLTMDYQEIFETWEVHEMVRSELQLNYSYEEMQEMMSVSNPEDTRLLYITITHTDPQLATDITNAYARAAKTFILQTMETREPNTFSVALVPGEASGIGKMTFVALGGMLGALIALLVICVRFALDDKPHTPEDITEAAGIPVFAVLPVEDAADDIPEKRRKRA